MKLKWAFRYNQYIIGEILHAYIYLTVSLKGKSLDVGEQMNNKLFWTGILVQPKEGWWNGPID